MLMGTCGGTLRTGLYSKGPLKAQKSLVTTGVLRFYNTVTGLWKMWLEISKNGGAVLTELFNSSPIAAGTGTTRPAIGELLDN